MKRIILPLPTLASSGVIVTIGVLNVCSPVSEVDPRRKPEVTCDIVAMLLTRS